MNKAGYEAILLTLLFSCSVVEANLPDNQNTTPDTVLETNEWQFKVLLDNREIGFHDFSVSREGNRRRVESKAQFDVRVMFVNIYRYRHETVENWSANCLSNISTETNANGKDFTVHGVSEKQQFVVSNGEAETLLPDCIMNFAYWNPEFLKSSQLLNSQTGDYEPVVITLDGKDNVTVNGEVIPANRYIVDVKAGPITLWYSSIDSRWLALESGTTGGRTIRYEPVSIPAATNSLVAR